MPLSVGTRKRRFLTNRLRFPPGRTSKIACIALLLLILNLIYVNVDVSRATGTQDVHENFSRAQDTLEELRQLEVAVNSDARTDGEHVKQANGLRPDKDDFRETSNESQKPAELPVIKSNGSGSRLDRKDIEPNANLTTDESLNVQEHKVEENAKPDHGIVSSESAVDENEKQGDDPHVYERKMNDTTKPASDLVTDGHAIKESKQQADVLGQDEAAAKQENYASESLDTERNEKPQETQERAVSDPRVEWLKYMQSLQNQTEEVTLTIFDVCPKACRTMTPLNISKELPLLKVETLDIAPKTVSLDNPPIPIIGTDQVHERMVSGLDVAEFMAHVTMWRRVFHGGGGNGVFISCQVKDPVPLLKSLRNDEWFRNETEGGTMGNETWDILLLGAGRPGAVPDGSIEKQVVSQRTIEDGDMLGYVVSQKGANELLRHVRAFTVPTNVFMSIIVERGLKVMRWDGAGLGEVRVCGGSKGEIKKSAKLPFYAPIHWIHAAARDKEG